MQNLLNEIREAKSSHLYHASLALALTLPDICGKAEPHKEVRDKQLYINWFNRSIYEHKYKNTNKTQFNGNACYALRCAVLHSGNLELEAVLIRKFRLSIHDHSGSIAVDKFDDETIDLNVISLIDNLVEGAEKSYILSSDKTYYNKFTYSIVDYTDALKIV